MSADDEFIAPLPLANVPIHPDELAAMTLVQLLDRLRSVAVAMREAQLEGEPVDHHFESISRIYAEIKQRCAAQTPQDAPQPD